MKKLIPLVAMLLLLSGCSQIMDSLYEPVDSIDNAKNYTLVIEEGGTVSEVASKLNEEKIISTSLAFKNYMENEGLSGELRTGEFELNSAMSIGEIAAIITEPQEERESVRVTFPEGYEVKDIIARLQENGLAQDEEHFRDVLVNYPFENEFLKDIDRSHYLEGYLFPDTYDFFVDESDEEIIQRMLDNFESKFTEELQARQEELGMSLNELMTLASIIEREARVDEEFKTISSVFHNRIDISMPLQACSTVQYILGERKPVLSIADTEIDSPYNTYQIPGLPPGPIAQPSMRAIEAALYPDETDYLFFVLKDETMGSHYFARTYEEHLQNAEEGFSQTEEVIEPEVGE